MRGMLAICDSFAKEYALIFIAKKSKLLLLGNAYHDISNGGFCIGNNVIVQIICPLGTYYFGYL